MQQTQKWNIRWLLLCSFGYFMLLFFHTCILYLTKLSCSTILIQTLYRFIVAVAPLLCTIGAIRAKKVLFRYTLFLLYIFVSPYPLYNFFQLRHISEIFPLNAHHFFTQANYINDIWKLIPVALYSFSQLLIFQFCLLSLSTQFPSGKYLMTPMICLFSALSVSIGLSSRLDTYHILTDMPSAFSTFTEAISSPSSMLNTIVIFAFSYSSFLLLVWLKNKMDRGKTSSSSH